MQSCSINSAELFYKQLDRLQASRRSVRGELLADSRKQDALKVLRHIIRLLPLARFGPQIWLM
jgi:hypothetical protein